MGHEDLNRKPEPSLLRPRCRHTIAIVLVSGIAILVSGCENSDTSGAASDPPSSIALSGNQSGESTKSASLSNLEVAESIETTEAGLSSLPGLEKNQFNAVVKQVADREDPEVDGWQSERFNEVTDLQLKQVGDAIADPASLEAMQLAVTHFTFTPLRPPLLKSVFDDEVIEVLRPDPDAGSGSQIEGGLDSAIKDLAKMLSGNSDVRFKFKTVRVELGSDPATDPITRSHFQISGRDAKRSVQLNAIWTCTWQASSDPPLLKSISVTDYEEVVHRLNAGRTLFSDCTKSVFRSSDVFERQLAHGIDFWTDRFDGAIARPAAGHGIAIGDVNNDGLDDVYLCQSPALPNLLLVQQPDGTVIDTAADASVNWLEGTRAALLNDLDNDGDEDLVAVLGSTVVIQENGGTGKFELKTVIDTVSSLFAINAVDYDNDSDLDLFICGYTLEAGVDVDDVFANPMPFEDATNGAPNVMLRNDGNWGFTDVTAATGMGNSNRFSYASSWDDYDGDGDMDCYIANDFGRNNLFRNDGGTFTDVAISLGVDDIGPGMSASWGDYNNDGLPDVYVSNMFSSAGNRITHNAQFKAGIDEKHKSDFQRHARGNSLFRNNGDGTFTDTSIATGVTLGRWAWGSVFADFNNDGWQDLYVTNGFITSDDPDRDL
jgi:hypothetical protein